VDHIRKALDLARQERDRGFEPTADQARTSQPRLGIQLPAAIQYSKTKAFTPPSGLLEASRIVHASGDAPAAAAFRMLRTQDRHLQLAASDGPDCGPK